MKPPSYWQNKKVDNHSTYQPINVVEQTYRLRDEFETRSLAATRRGFAFYVADPVSSIHEFTLNDQTTDLSIMKFVTIRALGHL